ncbi:MAG: hypothetical protein ACI4MU_00150 [Candidatus Ventricola sp.]
MEAHAHAGAIPFNSPLFAARHEAPRRFSVMCAQRKLTGRLKNKQRFVNLSGVGLAEKNGNHAGFREKVRKGY